ncbi:hypothetical protein [Merismopedia glauca]
MKRDKLDVLLREWGLGGQGGHGEENLISNQQSTINNQQTSQK